MFVYSFENCNELFYGILYVRKKTLTWSFVCLFNLFVCMWVCLYVSLPTHTHTVTGTNTQIHACMHARTHTQTCMHAHTHTHTHSYLNSISLPWFVVVSINWINTYTAAIIEKIGANADEMVSTLCVHTYIRPITCTVLKCVNLRLSKIVSGHQLPQIPLSNVILKATNGQEIISVLLCFSWSQREVWCVVFIHVFPHQHNTETCVCGGIIAPSMECVVIWLL